MRKLLFQLSRSALARKLGRALQLNRLGNAWLRKFPLTRKLSKSGVIYRATRLESIPLAVEMFEKNLYDATLVPKGFSTFVDLGCNVGYFTCWLAHLTGNPTMKGLMIDANPDATKEAQWHAQANGWKAVQALNGILGEASSSGFVDFYLYESNICSTSSVEQMKSLGLEGKWTKIQVPCLSLLDQWSKRFGAERCHLMKVDIEGSELGFLQAETEFLKRVDSVLVEWHKWRVAFNDLRAFLESKGFKLVKILDESAEMGTAFFARS